MESEMRQYVDFERSGTTFDTLNNVHPVCRRDVGDPRNDNDYDTFSYGTEPLPGDRTWARHAQRVAGVNRPSPWKGHTK